jgi:Antitoxin MazE-like
MTSRRERLREGLRPVQHWVPDLRDPKVLAQIRREVKLMAQHPENDAIDAWNEAIYDWDGLGPAYDWDHSVEDARPS